MTDEVKLRNALNRARKNAELAAYYRRELLRIGITTQCRQTYEAVAAIFCVKDTDRLYEIAKRESVV